MDLTLVKKFHLNLSSAWHRKDIFVNDGHIARYVECLNQVALKIPDKIPSPYDATDDQHLGNVAIPIKIGFKTLIEALAKGINYYPPPFKKSVKFYEWEINSYYVICLINEAESFLKIIRE